MSCNALNNEEGNPECEKNLNPGSMLFLAYDLYDAVPNLLYYLLDFGQQNPHRLYLLSLSSM